MLNIDALVGSHVETCCSGPDQRLRSGVQAYAVDVGVQEGRQYSTYESRGFYVLCWHH